jgi:hypothetical protein
MGYPSQSGRSVNATLPGGGVRPATSTGEGFPPGSNYSAVLVERPNKSLRNLGPERAESMPLPLPAYSQGQRKTGRVG